MDSMDKAIVSLLCWGVLLDSYQLRCKRTFEHVFKHLGPGVVLLIMYGILILFSLGFAHETDIFLV